MGDVIGEPEMFARAARVEVQRQREVFEQRVRDARRLYLHDATFHARVVGLHQMMRGFGTFSIETALQSIVAMELQEEYRREQQGDVEAHFLAVETALTNELRVRLVTDYGMPYEQARRYSVRFGAEPTQKGPRQ